ncbi:hypothetical protein CYMTET_5576 [Cymbomonas tetramitiformis]|uniref:Uncharacterized protein n=1 Tax=Cymbomonas tetramitiformis TaxID=36881 RepID=A0AAE0LIY1_9CHLO|nr:hypothetical protein CYMTET_5576 [Cymbomonas tetramitiformis]
MRQEAVGAALGTLGAWLIQALRHHRRKREAQVYELNGLHYQVLGHAWDHEIKDFKVVYRPLYHCVSEPARFEAHVLAVSHFSRWESKFNRVPLKTLPAAARRRVLAGPFTWDSKWPALPEHAASLPKGVRSRSGLGTRSHEPILLEQVLGDVKGFIETVHNRLVAAGFDAAEEGLEMDHICYRCESVQEYQDVLAALVPTFGTCMVEGMIGGRPITTVLLKEPFCHAGYSVACVEVPCPKPNRHYVSGLEHVEIVVGSPEDGVEGNQRLLDFMDACRQKGMSFNFDDRALSKTLNADISVTLTEPAPVRGYHNLSEF